MKTETEKSAAPSRSSPQFMLRLPEGLREKLKTEAAGSRRSMNNEIVVLVEQALAARQQPAVKQ